MHLASRNHEQKLFSGITGYGTLAASYVRNTRVASGKCMSKTVLWPSCTRKTTGKKMCFTRMLPWRGKSVAGWHCEVCSWSVLHDANMKPIVCSQARNTIVSRTLGKGTLAMIKAEYIATRGICSATDGRSNKPLSELNIIRQVFHSGCFLLAVFS